MDKQKRDDTLIEAVKQAKSGQFGLTAIKIEFEARFNRRAATREPITCQRCDGDGYYIGEPTHLTINCEACSGNGVLASPFNDMRHLHDLILAKLVRQGLAKRIPRNHPTNRTYGHKYMPIAPLVYSKVYEDGTVDTEQTLTLLLDDPSNILLLPKLSNAFYGLKDVIGQEVDVSNAGMHMALLNAEGGVYPVSPTNTNMIRFNNFRRSMILLLPAIYFLGSASKSCRPLNFRKPDLSSIDKYSAIAYRGGALEFRVFETCYGQPEMMFDNVMVMLNCLKFWTRKYTRNHLAKVANNITFGKEGDAELKRLYVTTEHIDLLNRGLRMIKPQWRSITELKKQRDFTVTKLDIKDNLKAARVQAEVEYKQYEERFSWEMVMRRNNFIARQIEQKYIYPTNGLPLPVVAEGLAPIEAEADKTVEEFAKSKQSIDNFCEGAVKRLTNAGDYRLAVV